MIRVRVVRQLRAFHVDVVLFLDQLIQLRLHPQTIFRIHVGDECRLYFRAVLVRYVCIRDDVGEVTFYRGDDREGRAKQKELYAVILVPLEDLAEDGKGRIVHHDLVLPVLCFLIVASRIEWPHKVLFVHLELLRHPVRNDLVNVFRSVTVVRGLLDLELLHKGVVFVVPFLPRLPVALASLEPLVIQIQPEVRHVHFRDLRQFLLQVAHVPFRLVELVVRKAQRLDLVLAQVFSIDARHRRQLQDLRRLEPSVSYDHHVVLVQDHRLLPSKKTDAVRDLLHLLSRVQLRVFFIRFDFFCFNILYCHAFLASSWRSRSSIRWFATLICSSWSVVFSSSL